MKTLKTVLLATCFLLSACGTQVPTPANIQNSQFPNVQGKNLNGETIVIPQHFRGKPTLVLVGYTQRAQFDIDRWILGALQVDLGIEIVELPTIAGMMPQMVQGFIDNGMRKGIPQSDWASVVTIYEDASKIIAVLGNDRPQSAYVVLLDKDGRIAWSTNIGYSPNQILELKKLVAKMAS
jgi:hypothetical protein